jgi:hypothetical protein
MLLPTLPRDCSVAGLIELVDLEGLHAPLRQRQRSPRLLCLGIATGSNRAPNRYVWRHERDDTRGPDQIDVVPHQCAQLFGPCPRQERQQDVGIHTRPSGRRQHSVCERRHGTRCSSVTRSLTSRQVELLGYQRLDTPTSVPNPSYLRRHSPSSSSPTWMTYSATTADVRGLRSDFRR